MALKVWHVGVSLLKSELYGWLRVNQGDPWYCHFPMYDEAYFKGLTSEELITTKNKSGHTVQRWVKKFTRNEPRISGTTPGSGQYGRHGLLFTQTLGTHAK